MDERIHGKDEVSGSSPDRGSIIAFRNICFTSQLRLFEAGVFLLGAKPISPVHMSSLGRILFNYAINIAVNI